jgi:hypothetical protein
MSTSVKFNVLGAKDFFKLYPLTGISAGPVVQPPIGIPQLPVGRTRGDGATGQATVKKEARVLTCDIQPANSPIWTVYTHNCRKAVKAVIAGFGGPIPLFHLPYNNDQNYRITLVDRQNVGNVDFFLTELVNGCSVYVEGTAQEPTVYHINAIATKHDWALWAPFRYTGVTAYNYWTSSSMNDWNWSAKSNKMDARFKGDKQKPKTVRNQVPGLLPASKVENQDYMTPQQAEANVEGRLANFQASGKAPGFIGGQSVDSMKFMLSEGSVFGARTGGNWKFYIQKRVLVEYFHDLPRTSLGRQQLILGVEQFWPQTKTGRLVG